MAKPAAPARTQQLHKSLYQLQATGSAVWRDMRRTNRAFYAHVAEVYFWWRDASAVAGYLEAGYAKLNRQFKSRVKYGINFSPLLVLVWGNDNCATADLDRHSRALNSIATEFESRPKYYAKDGIAKMALFIERNHGIHGLTGYGNSTTDADEDELEDDTSTRPAAATTPVSESAKAAALLAAAKAHYAGTQHTPALPFSNAIPVTDDDLAVILVKRSATGYQLLGATNDAELVERAAVVNFKHRFSALPVSVRTVIETLRTQCLPPHILKIQRELVDKSHQKHSDGGNKLSVRRLLYRHSMGDFVLSPVRAHAGVVTLAKPKQPVLDAVDSDVFLSSRARLLLERRAIANYDFNLYQTETVTHIQRYSSEDSASHMLRLQSLADESDFLHLDFWNYRAGESAAIPQVDIEWLGKMDWHHELPLSWFRHLSLEVVDKWFDSHARHIKREHQRVCHVQLTRDAMTLQFVRRNSTFEVQRERPFPNSTSGLVSLNLYFLTKDLMPVLKAIADFEISTPIQLSATKHALFLMFDTDAAHYSVAIPTTNERGVRNTGAFTSYTPAQAAHHAFESDDEPFDYEQEALSWQPSLDNPE
jgi:hypothetical protein